MMSAISPNLTKKLLVLTAGRSSFSCLSVHLSTKPSIGNAVCMSGVRPTVLMGQRLNTIGINDVTAEAGASRIEVTRQSRLLLYRHCSVGGTGRDPCFDCCSQSYSFYKYQQQKQQQVYALLPRQL